MQFCWSLSPWGRFASELSPRSLRSTAPSEGHLLTFDWRPLGSSILWSGSAPCPRSQPAGGVWAPRPWPLTGRWSAGGWSSQSCPLCSSSPSHSQKLNHSRWRPWWRGQNRQMHQQKKHMCNLTVKAHEPQQLLSVWPQDNQENVAWTKGNL